MDAERREALRTILRTYPGNSAAAQRSRIVAAIEMLGAVDTLEIRKYLDSIQSATRVFELRNRDGRSIVTHWIHRQTDCGQVHRVALYAAGPA